MNDWWCQYCNSVVIPENVTYEETHDPRSGGCDGKVFGGKFAHRESLEDKVAALKAENAQQAERIKALEAENAELRARIEENASKDAAVIHSQIMQKEELQREPSTLRGNYDALLEMTSGCCACRLDEDGEEFTQQCLIHADAMKELSTLRESARWIPCSERLPIDDMVDIYEVVCRDIHTKRRYEDEVYWQMSFWEVPDSVVIEYWREFQPLPKPPEDGSEREIVNGEGGQ